MASADAMHRMSCSQPHTMQTRAQKSTTEGPAQQAAAATPRKPPSHTCNLLTPPGTASKQGTNSASRALTESGSKRGSNSTPNGTPQRFGGADYDYCMLPKPGSIKSEYDEVASKLRHPAFTLFDNTRDDVDIVEFPYANVTIARSALKRLERSPTSCVNASMLYATDEIINLFYQFVFRCMHNYNYHHLPSLILWTHNQKS